MVELLSYTDRRRQTEAKMKAWLANGVSLAWLIDPYRKIVTVYGSSQEVRTTKASKVEGAGPVSGFILDVTEVWSCYEI